MEPTVSVARFETLRMSYSSVKNQVHSRTGSGRQWVVAGKSVIEQVGGVSR